MNAHTRPSSPPQTEHKTPLQGQTPTVKPPPQPAQAGAKADKIAPPDPELDVAPNLGGETQMQDA